MCPACMVTILFLECFVDFRMQLISDGGLVAFDPAESLCDLKNMSVNGNDFGTVHAEQKNTVCNFSADALKFNQVFARLICWNFTERIEPLFTAILSNCFAAIDNIFGSIPKSELAKFGLSRNLQLRQSGKGMVFLCDQLAKIVSQLANQLSDTLYIVVRGEDERNGALEWILAHAAHSRQRLGEQFKVFTF